MRIDKYERTCIYVPVSSFFSTVSFIYLRANMCFRISRELTIKELKDREKRNKTKLKEKERKAKVVRRMEVSTENTGKKSRTLSYETIRDRKITT